MMGALVVASTLADRVGPPTGRDGNGWRPECRSLARDVVGSSACSRPLPPVQSLAEETSQRGVSSLRRRATRYVRETRLATGRLHAALGHPPNVLVAAGRADSRRRGHWIYGRRKRPIPGATP